MFNKFSVNLKSRLVFEFMLTYSNITVNTIFLIQSIQ